MTPQRIQRKRTKGWRMPENTICISRPAKFSNPFDVETYGQKDAMRLFAVSISLAMVARLDAYKDSCLLPEVKPHVKHFKRMACDLHELRGKNLACYCPLDQPCHADVLLRLANTQEAR